MIKKIFLIGLLSISAFCAQAQESFGKTLNLGLGIGYGYRYYGAAPLLINYEIQVAKNVTVAPFIEFYSYSRDYYWGNPHYPYYSYHSRTTVIPIGAKGFYYFDDLLTATAKWDFYGALSIGVVTYHKTTWDNNYPGEQNAIYDSSPVYLELHAGARYHFNEKIGAFLDLSSGFSSIGLSIKTR